MASNKGITEISEPMEIETFEQEEKKKYTPEEEVEIAISQRERYKSEILFNKSLEELQNELKMAQEGTHPVLKKYAEIIEMRKKEGMEKYEVELEMRHRRAVQEYNAREKKIAEEMDRDLKLLKEEMMQELELEEKNIHAKFSENQISKFDDEDEQCSSNVRTLRSRKPVNAEKSSPAFKASETQKGGGKSSLTNNNSLLAYPMIASSEAVNDDLQAIFGNVPNKKSSKPSKKPVKAKLFKTRLTYNDKPYKVGDEVYVETEDFGKIPTTVTFVNEKMITFTSSLPYDSRQIFASEKDILDGRVLLSKKK